MLQTAVAAARHGARIGRSTLDRLSDEAVGWPGPWPVGATDDLIALLLEGHRAVPVLESLDQRNLVARLLPEWEPVRSKPQRNAYHRFTVDRHLWEAAANAADLVGRVTRPDLLVLGGLFHDLGKGYPGDHTVVGMELIRSIGPKLGLVHADVEVLVTLIEQHLLLPDVAMRRDLTDPATIRHVADAVKTVEVLDLLHALDRGRLAGHRSVGVGRLEGGAGRRTRRPGPSRARWRRRRGGDVAAVPRRRDPRRDGDRRTRHLPT